MPAVWLIYGGTGWIGGQLEAMLRRGGETVHLACARFENRSDVEKELDAVRPTYVLNCAGVVQFSSETGRPNVDWCEDHKAETVRANVLGTLTLIDVCFLRKIHVTNFATGCIYEYDDMHPQGSGIGFTEDEKHNYLGSWYSQTKSIAETILTPFLSRMPISDDLHTRNFITKISKYEKVVNVPNSVTILTDLLPVALDMTRKLVKGIFNFTNPGTVSHNDVLALYKKYIKPDFEWKNFSVEEQAKILKAGRSNNELDVSKLLSLYPSIPNAKDSIVAVFKRMRNHMGMAPVAE